jgi:predicted nucleotidyltransferase
MIIHKILNEIFTTYSHIAILRELRFSKNGFSGREIATNAGISPPSCLAALSKLEKLKIVNRQIGGNVHIYTLNFNNILVKEGLLPLLEIEQSLPNKIISLLKKTLSKKSVSVILFGSVARLEETHSSDYDLCIVYQTQSDKKKLEEIINHIRQNFYSQFGISIAPYFISTSDFELRAKKKLSPVNDIVKEGKVIFGKSIRNLLND